MKILFDKKPLGAARKDSARIVLEDGKQTEIVRLTDGGREIVLGIGKRAEMTRRKLILLARRVVVEAKKCRCKKIAVAFEDFDFSHLKMAEADLAELLSVNFEMANFEFTEYRTKPKDGWNFVEEIFVDFGGGGGKGAIAGGESSRDNRKSEITTAIERAFKKGQIIGQEINACRALSNTPGGDMTPALLAEAAKKAAKGTSIKVTILNKKEIERNKMGGVLGVARGSSEEPKFIVMEYFGAGKGAAKKEKPIVLVGKGVTFDTGGLNVKPDMSMYEMHLDMSGGAAVIAAIVAATKLGLKRNVVALVPAVENMPSGSSYRPGDVLRSMSGQTIEVLHTDAEGRVILADALTYAKKYNPALVVDVATLTGAAVEALGVRASAIFSKDATLAGRLVELGEESGDFLWPLPLWEEYEDDIKGTFGDWANIGKKQHRGGAIMGAIFLYQFAKDFPWAHIDIAPRMTAIDGDFLAKGASGTPVRLLVKLLEKGTKQ